MSRLHMYTFSTVAVLLASLLIWGGCGGSKNVLQAQVGEAISKVPDWYLNPPNDPNFIYGTGTNDSRDLQMARNAAEHAARVQITRNTEAKVSALFKSF